MFIQNIINNYDMVWQMMSISQHSKAFIKLTEENFTSDGIEWD